MNWCAIKDYIHQISVGVALFLILITGIVVDVRLIRGSDFPSGYDTWIWALIALAGVNVAGLTAIRATAVPYVAAKAAGASGPPQVSVAGDATVQTSATAEHPAVPQAGVLPTNPDVRAAMQALAAKQRDAANDPGIL